MTLSKENLDEFKKSGNMLRHQDIVLRTMEMIDYEIELMRCEHSIDDISDHCDLSREQVRKRMPELIRQGKVKKCGKTCEKYPRQLYSLGKDENYVEMMKVPVGLMEGLVKHLTRVHFPSYKPLLIEMKELLNKRRDSR